MKAETIVYILFASLYVFVIGGLFLRMPLIMLGIPGSLAIMGAIMLKYSPDDDLQIWRRLKSYILLNARYNLIVMPVIMAIYIPYNVLFIHYSAFQLLKWVSTSWLVSLGANAIISPWVSFAHKRGWLK